MMPYWERERPMATAFYDLISQLKGEPLTTRETVDIIIKSLLSGEELNEAQLREVENYLNENKT